MESSQEQDFVKSAFFVVMCSFVYFPLLPGTPKPIRASGSKSPSWKIGTFWRCRMLL